MQNFDRPPGDPELKRRIQDLIAYKGEGYNPDLVADIIENALKLMTDVVQVTRRGEEESFPLTKAVQGGQRIE